MMGGTYLIGVVFSLLVFLMIILALRNSGMKEKYSIWWFLVGVAVLVVSIFPAVLTWVAKSLGVVVPLNLGFFLSGVVLLLMTLQFSVDLSRSDAEKRHLVEEVALLKQRIEVLERKTGVSRRPRAGADATGFAPDEDAKENKSQ
ncbi:DUF2304 domain-containing protein [Mobiluncus curtisii]|uniref:DUF2304 domain-containing protein n=1 Tax=Mobiluncus curtisii ATCC 51333 TaxID=887326 RepID=E6LXJ2_9ACTO|nr:DUF2304 domain-containing protein [Mobiluncus curtisii]EFU80359.1 hypothetical protein HMPREF0388_0579 [Mobiluncus curtisii ATCC 51333]